MPQPFLWSQTLIAALKAIFVKSAALESVVLQNDLTDPVNLNDEKIQQGQHKKCCQVFFIRSTLFQV